MYRGNCIVKKAPEVMSSEAEVEIMKIANSLRGEGAAGDSDSDNDNGEDGVGWEEEDLEDH